MMHKIRSTFLKWWSARFQTRWLISLQKRLLRICKSLTGNLRISLSQRLPLWPDNLLKPEIVCQSIRKSKYFPYLEHYYVRSWCLRAINNRFQEAPHGISRGFLSGFRRLSADFKRTVSNVCKSYGNVAATFRKLGKSVKQRNSAVSVSHGGELIDRRR